MSETKEKSSYIDTKTSIYQLPPSILLNIFRFLDLKSLSKSSMVCRLWHNYANDPSLWKVIDLGRYQLSLRRMWKIVPRRVSECTKELHIKGLVTATKTLQNLSSPLLEEIKGKATNLTNLRLINCYLKNVSIESFPSCITHLSLSESLVPLGWFDPLKNKTLFPSLKYLSLASCTRISSEDISSICQLKTLRTLILSGCYRITDDDVRQISTNLKNLTKLDLCNCGKIKDDSLRHIACHLKDIQSLLLGNCHSITPVGIAAFKHGHLNELVFLNIQGCSNETQMKALRLFADNTKVTLKTCVS